jgi:hypothetical protein
VPFRSRFAAEHVHQAVRGHVARDFTGCCAPHAIANHEYALLSAVAESILIVRSDDASVGASRYLKLQWMYLHRWF